MTSHWKATPLRTPVQWPDQRSGGFPAELLAACIGAKGTEAGLAALQAPDCLVVTTGQQPGLFTGPLYTIHKALSAAALASQLEARWGRRVVPVFWIAGDDHDFAEANHASWIAADGRVTTHTLRARPPEAPLIPMYREPLGPEVDGALEALAAALPPGEFRDSTLEWLRRHYRADRTVAGAYGGALAELLAPQGVICLESTHPAVKRAAGPRLIEALRLAAGLDHELATRHGELQRESRDPGVAVGDGATLVMIEGNLGRDRLVIDGTDYVTRRGGERFSLSAIQDIAATSPERLSANVLLRPVIEASLLPTVAYVAGPGELRYLELTPPIYQRLGVDRQLPVPRWSGMLVEPRVERVLEKFGASVEELVAPGQALESRLARTQLPAEGTDALNDLRAALERNYGVLARVAAGIDPTMEKPVLNSMHSALGQSQEIEKRLVQHLKKRGETEAGQIARARSALLPLGKAQERVLTVAPLLSRYGPQLLLDLRESITAWYTGALEGAPVPS